MRVVNEVDYIKSILEKMQNCVDDHKNYLKANKVLHFGIYRLAKSPVLMQVVDNLWARVAPYFNSQVLDADHIREVAMPCHEKMVEALYKRDKSLIRKAIKEDLTRAAGRIKALLDSEEGDSYLNEHFKKIGW